MKKICIISVFLIFAGTLTAGLNITQSDLQTDASGYYYEYELTYADMYDTSQFFSDLESSSNISVYAPTGKYPRYIYADTGTNGAHLKYKFDFSTITVGPENYRVGIKSIHIRDSLTMSNNAAGTEESTAVSAWSLYDYNYTTIVQGATPRHGIQTFPGTLSVGFGGFVQEYLYSVEFTNSRNDFNGFDEQLNQWNNQTSSSDDWFKVTVRLDLTAPEGTYAGGAGFYNSPYQIATAQQLDALRDYPEDWDKYFVLTADIDISGYLYDTALIAYDTVEGNSSFDGIKFSGSFDGQGHTISNLNLGSDNADFAGLFGEIENGTVSNLNLKNVKVKGSSYAGGIAGYCDGNIENCTVQGSVTGISVLGLIAGGTDLAASISNCSVRGSCTGVTLVGGLIGINWATVENCDATGTLTAFSQGCGGLTGTNHGRLRQCSANADVTGGSYVGGLSGYMSYSEYRNIYIENCYSNCRVGVSDDDGVIGGFVGRNLSTVTNCWSAADLTCFSDSFTGILGGFVGQDDSNTVEGTASYSGCFWDSDVAGTTDDVGDSGGGAIPDPDPDGILCLNNPSMKIKSIYTSYDWDYVGETVNGTDDIWNIIEGVTYPRFAYECINPPAGDLNGDCVFDLFDFAEAAADWLNCGKITPELCP